MKKCLSLAVCLTALLVALSFIGCTEPPNIVGATKSGTRQIEIICIDGVEYLHYREGHGSNFAPHFKKDGSLYLCN